MPLGIRNLKYIHTRYFDILNPFLSLSQGSLPISGSFLVVTIYAVQFEDIFSFPILNFLSIVWSRLTAHKRKIFYFFHSKIDMYVFHNHENIIIACLVLGGILAVIRLRLF